MQIADDHDNGLVMKSFLWLVAFCVLVIIPGAWYIDDMQSAKECTGEYNTRACHQRVLDDWNKLPEKQTEGK
jgi:hypothetical protein